MSAPGAAADGSRTYDVAVVGYGPVGMMSAVLLAQQGRSVVVLERYPGLFSLPRAAAIDDETMHTLDTVGVAERVLPTVRVQESYEWRSTSGELLMQHAYSTRGRLGWAQWYSMYQPALEEALDHAVRASGRVDVRMSTRVTAYDQDRDGVIVHLQDGADVRARYAVACDGGNGFTREALGIGMDDDGFEEPWLVCDLELTREVPDLPVARQICDPARPTAIMALGPTHHRVSVMLDSQEELETERDPERAWGRIEGIIPRGSAELIRVATYTFRSRIARRWRDGRILLAGDAAHQLPPFLGQGMLSGLRDARNLAFKLARVLDGRSSDALLDTYEAERKPHVTAIMRMGVELGRLQTIRDPEEAARRDAGMLRAREANAAPRVVRVPDLAGGALDDASAGAGELMVQDEVADARDDARLDLLSRIQPAHDPVLLHRADLDDAVARLLPRLRDQRIVPVRVVGSDHTPGAGEAARGATVVDLHGTYADWFDEHGANAVVVRPDTYVFGTAADEATLAALVDRWEERLA